MRKKRDGLAHARCACAGKVAGYAAVVVRCGTNVPSQFAVELPRASILRVDVCYDLGARRCYGRCTKVVRAVDVRVRRKCWVASRVSEEVECQVGLWYQAVPFGHGEVGVDGRQSRFKMVLPRLDCAFGEVAAMGVRWY